MGQIEIKKLVNLDYKTKSHTFSKGVIAAYYNLLEYPGRIEKDWIQVKRRKGNVYFLLRPNIIPTGEVLSMKKDVFYSLVKTPSTPVKTKEVVYDLEQIFTKPNKEVRRGMNLINRKEIICTTGAKGKEIEQLYNEWSEHKMSDPKVYRIAFTPKRYLRSFQLYDNRFKVKEFAYYINGELYGTICYEKQEDIAFELAFISRFWRKDLKFCNDLNELILIDSFYQLWKQGVKRINVGPTAGIKGLKTFKNKLPNYEYITYSN